MNRFNWWAHTRLDDMKDEVLAGIYILSHDSNSVAHARVWNVRIDKPVQNVYTSNPHVAPVPMKDVLGSRLEILDLADGSRHVIREAAGRFEAPNWMPDGKKLLFNEGGSLYTIPVEGGTPEKLNTGTSPGTTMIMQFLLTEKYWPSAVTAMGCRAVVPPFIHCR